MREQKTFEGNLKNIWEGLLFHCKDLAEFMSENADNPFFETETGKLMRRHAAKLLLEHTMGLLLLETSEFQRKNEEKKGNDSLEEMLKGLGTEFETD